MSYQLGILGTGHMGGSIARGWLQSGNASSSIAICDHNEQILASYHDEFAIATFTDSVELVQACDSVVLAIKPDQCQQTCQAIAPVDTSQLIISVVAGIRCQQLQQWLGDAKNVVRAMPNVAGQVGSSASGLFALPEVNEAQRSQAESVLRAIGTAVWLEQEEQLDIVTALAGSGPAYYFLFTEYLAQAAMAMGLAEDVADLLARETAAGAAHMALQSEYSLADLRAQVTSPNGTTAAALAVFEDSDFKQICVQALHKAQQRAIEIADEFSGVEK